ncbi:MAG: endopeptidase La [Candidatus Aegiribacteria sp.]|nr:endopeptidase La [Candidatus Aegiribacteria sp.]
MTRAITLELPEILPVLPSPDGVVYPFTVVPRTITKLGTAELVDDAVRADKLIGVVSLNSIINAPARPADLYRTGTVTGIDRLYRFPGNIIRLHLRGLIRFRILEFIETSKPYLLARVEKLESIFPEDDVELNAWHNTVGIQLKQIFELTRTIPDDSQFLELSADPDRLSFLAASRIEASVEEKQKVLEVDNVLQRLCLLSGIMEKEIRILKLRNKIQGQVRTEIEKDQKEYILKEQMKAIQKELGGDTENPDAEELKQQIEEKDLPEKVEKAAMEELDRLKRMHPGLPEVAVIRNYIEWILNLPWKESTKDRLDINRAQRVLEKDHYDLEDVKERVLEFLAVRKLNPSGKAPILCFVGPPGVGKTSMGKSIARAIGRKFVRLSLGGVHDEAEIRGHRRTYIGAMPGKIIQGLKEAGSNNPVFMLDEVDKIGSDFRGDPTSALLEVLDPEQNFSFRDNYMNVPFDLSGVQFITTANRLDTIPSPLLDRMEIIRIPGYTSAEKLEIARRYLVERQMNNAGLAGDVLRFRRKGLSRIISDYTREAGVRELERTIGKICRKVAMKVAGGNNDLVIISAPRLPEFLGPRKFTRERISDKPRIGVSTALAWTPAGGEILLIETTIMSGKGELILTGQLGQVMQESVKAALSWIRTHADEYGLKMNFKEVDIHLHVPAGATPKDGPSAGVAILVSILSALSEKPVVPDIAVTGEISLQGRVMPVGGIKEKTLGALAAGITRVFLPFENSRNIEEIPEETRKLMHFELIKRVQDVIESLIPGLKEVGA